MQKLLKIKIGQVLANVYILIEERKLKRPHFCPCERGRKTIRITALKNLNCLSFISFLTVA